MKQIKPLLTGAIIGVFCLLLAAPTLEQLFNPIVLEPVVESRAKVPPPSGNVFAQLWGSQGYFAAYEKHYNDVFGFRDFFIRLRNQIQYSLFRDSDQVIVGREGWLVDKPSVEIEQHTVDTLTAAQWERLMQRLVRLKRILERRGITFLIVPVPFKNTVYPDKFPQWAVRRPAPTGYERFRRLLSANNLPFVDAYGILEQQRSSGVYYRTDLHWNLLGARLVSKQIVERLAHDTGHPVRWRYPDATTSAPLSGGVESNLLAVFWPPEDVEPVAYQPGEECGTVPLAGVTVTTVFLNQCRGVLLPQAMLFGNSFRLQMAAVGFQDHFSKMFSAYDIGHFGHLLSEIQPGTKILIWQNFELEIGYQMQDDAFWQEVDAYKGTLK